MRYNAPYWKIKKSKPTIDIGTKMEKQFGRQIMKPVTFLCLLALLVVLFATNALATAPPVPTGVSAAPGNAQITISWSASTGATSYLLYRGTTSGGEGTTAIATITAPTVTYTNSSLTNGTKYYYDVKASSSGGTSTASSEVSGTPIATPSGLAVAPGTAQNVLTWSADSGSSSYSVYSGSSVGGESATAIATGITTTTYTNTGLTNGSKVYYVIKALSGTYTTPASNEAAGTPFGVPTGLTATGGATQVSLVWSSAAGDVNYSVYRGTTAGGESSTAVVTGLTSPSYVNTGLTNGSTYYYTVKSYVGSTLTVASNEASAIPLGAPSSLAETPASNAVALTWSANSSGATGYNIYRGVSAGGESGTALGTSTTASYTDSTAVNGTLYYYVVKATNSTFVGSASNEVGSDPMATPSSVTASPLAASVQLSWSLGSGATSVNVYRGTSTNGESTTAVATAVSSPYTNTGLTNGTKYYYKLRAVNSTGTSSVYSSEVNAKPVAIPATPTGLSASQNGNYINLSWSGVSGAATYNVYRATTSGGEGSSPTYSGIATNSYNDSSLTGGITYYYEVTAVNGSGESGKSTEVSFVAPTPPGAPTGLAVGSVNASSASFTWNSVPAAAYYVVYCSLTSGGEANSPLNTISYVTSGTVNSLSAGTTYYAIVEANGSTGTNSGFSNEVSFTTTVASVGNLTAVWLSNSAVLNWTASVGATSYTIERQLNFAGPLTPIGSTSSTTYTDTTASAQPLGTYLTYYVVATSSTSVDPTPPSISIQAPIGAPTGVTAVGGYESVLVTWNAPAGGNSYIVKRSTTSGGPYTPVDYPGTTGSPVTFTDSSLADNTTYYYIVGSTYLDGTTSGAEVDSSQVSATTSPAIPASLTATASVDRGIALSWTASAGAAAYNIYESSVTGGPYTKIASASGASYTVSGLTDSTAYYYVVTAVNSAGAESQYSNEATATTWPSPPYLTATPGNATVTLNWTAVSGALGYTVYRSAWGEFSFANVSGMTPISATTYVDSTVTNGVDYYYAVTYTNSYGESFYSNIADAIPNSSAAGGEVYQINSGGPAVGSWVADEFTTAPSTYSTTNFIDLSKAVSPAPEAVYQTCDVSNLPFSYTIPGLTPNAAYLVRLHFADAYDTLPGQRVESISLQGTTVAANYDIIEAAGGPNIANVAQFNTTADSSGNISIGFNGVVNYPIVSGVEIVSGSGVPTTPLGLYAIPGHAQVLLGWSGYAGLTGYNVYRGTTSGGPYALITSTPVSGTTYTDSTVSNGTTYYYVVTAVNSVGESLRSNEAYATPAAVNASIYRINCGGPAVGNWAADTQGYIFSTTTTPILTGLSNPAPAAVYQTFEYGSISHTLPNLAPGGNYVLRLHFDNYSPGSNTSEVNVTINGAQVLTNFDARAASGAAGKAVIEQFNVTADTSGNITVASVSGVLTPGGPSGIELLTDSLPPSQPTRLFAWRGNTQVSLNWSPVYGAATYNVYRSLTSGGTYAQVASGLASPTYSDPTVTNYYYVVTAVNSTGESGYSNQAYPAAPFTLSANPASIHCSNGSSVTSHITAVSNTGFTGTINFTGTGTGSGISALLYPSSGVMQLDTQPDTSITVGTSLQMCVSGAANGTYPLTVTGTSGDYTENTTVNLSVP